MATKKKAQSVTVAPQPAAQGQKPATTPATQSRTAGYVPATASTMKPAQAAQPQSRTVAAQPQAQGQQPARTPATQTQGYVPATGSTMNPQPQTGRGDGSHVANQQAHNPYANAQATATSTDFNMGTTGQTVHKAGTVRPEPAPTIAPPPPWQGPNVGAPYSPTAMGLPTTQGIPVWNQYVVPPKGADWNQYAPGRPAPVWNQYTDKADSRYWDRSVPQGPGTQPTMAWTQQDFEQWRAGERGDPGAWNGNPQPAKVRDTLKHRGNIVNGVPGVEVVGVNDTAVTGPAGYVDQGLTDYWPTGDANGNGQWDPREQWGRGGGYSRPWYDYQQQVQDWFPGMMNWRF